MTKRKMKFIQSPEDLVRELHGNKKSRMTVMKEVRDQCFGSLPRKQAFFDSDVMAVLLGILKDTVNRLDDTDDQETLVTCLHLFASLVQAENVNIPHAQEFAAAVPHLFGLALSGTESQQRAGLRALLEIYKLVHRVCQVQEDADKARSACNMLQGLITADRIDCVHQCLCSKIASVANMAAQLVCYLPQVASTKLLLAQKLLLHFAKCFQEAGDVSEDVIAAYCSLLPCSPGFCSDDHPVEGYTPLPQLSLLTEKLRSGSLDCRLDCCQILLCILMRTPEGPSGLGPEEALAIKRSCTQALQRILKDRPLLLAYRAPQLLIELVGRHEDGRQGMIDSGIVGDLLAHAELAAITPHPVTRHYLDAARCFGHDALISNFVHSSGTSIELSEQLLLDRIAADFHQSNPVLKIAILKFWTCLTSRVRWHCLFKLYFKDRPSECLQLATDRACSIELRTAAVDLYTNLLLGYTMPQGQTDSEVHDMREYGLAQLWRILEHHRAEGAARKLVWSAMNCVAHVFAWDCPKTQLLDDPRFKPGILFELFQTDDLRLQSNVASLIVNLSAGISEIEARCLLSWLGFEGIIELSSYLTNIIAKVSESLKPVFSEYHSFVYVLYEHAVSVAINMTQAHDIRADVLPLLKALARVLGKVHRSQKVPDESFRDSIAKINMVFETLMDKQAKAQPLRLSEKAVNVMDRINSTSGPELDPTQMIGALETLSAAIREADCSTQAE